MSRLCISFTLLFTVKIFISILTDLVLRISTRFHCAPIIIIGAMTKEVLPGLAPLVRCLLAANGGGNSPDAFV